MTYQHQNNHPLPKNHNHHSRFATAHLKPTPPPPRAHRNPPEQPPITQKSQPPQQICHHPPQAHATAPLEPTATHQNNHPVTQKSQQPPQKPHITGFKKPTNLNNHHNKNPLHRCLKTHKP
jgi:hypothetical protein